MFAKLKDKLKSALSIFSRKAEEEAEVKVVETQVEIKPKEIAPEVKPKEVISEAKPKAIAPEVKAKEVPPEAKAKEVPKKEEKKVEKKKEEPKRVIEKKEILPEKKEPIPEKELVLIIHGWEDNAESGFIPALKESLHKNNIKSLSFDQPHTEKPQFEEWFSFAERKIAEHKAASLSIVGHSMGGLLALKLAEKYKLKKLILVAPVGSNPSEAYFTLMGRRLSAEDLSVFRRYQSRDLDMPKIKNNSEEIAFLFGLKDEWITDEIRSFYLNSFKDVAEIHLFEEYGHMSQSEGVKELPILEEFFSRKTKTGIIEHKKSFFGKLFGKKEEAPPPAVSEEKQPTSEKISVEETKYPEEQKTFFDKLKQSLTTKTISAEKFNELFWDLEIVLLENNVSVEVIEKIKKDLEKELVDKPLPRDVESKIMETLKKTLLDILTFEDINLLGKINEKSKQKKPFIIAFFGINGTGKTTSIAKLTHYFQQQKKSVVLAACDTFRAAAIQQLEEHADKLGVKMIKQDYGSDAAAVAFDAVKYAEKNKIDIVLIDTAGRLHSNTNLMAELEKIIRIAKPDFKIFVGESITGNDCIEQARQFNQLVEMDGVILTKADVDEKGGAPLSIAYTIKKPILFLGVGQRYQDLEKFEAQQIVKRLGL